MPLVKPPPLGHWLLAAGVGCCAVALRAGIQPLIGDALPFVVAFPALVLASLLWGTGPGMVTLLICAAGVALSVYHPLLPGVHPTVLQPGLHLSVQLGTFVLGGTVVALICGQRMRSALRPQAGTLAESAAGEAGATALETPLTAWLRAVLWSAFLIPMIAFVVLAWWGYERAERNAEATLAQARSLAYRHAERTFASAEELVRRADDAASAPDDQARSAERGIHQRLSDLGAGFPAIVNLNVWDAEGHFIARSDRYPVDPQVSVKDRAYFQEHLHGHPGPGISEVLRGRQTGRELLNLSIRRDAASPAFRGVVAASISPDNFRDFYRTLASERSNGATLELARLDGKVLARYPAAASQAASEPYNTAVLEALGEGRSEGRLTLDARTGQPARLVSFARVEDYPIYVAASVSREAMFASWVQFVSLAAALLVPLTASLVFVSWLALKKTRQELAMAAELQDQVRRRAKAERSMLESQKLETLAVVTGGVAHDFNNLLAIVSASLHVLKRRHPGLEAEKQMVAMSRAVASGTRLTRQLLSFSRKQALRPEAVALQAWLPSTEGLIQSTLGPNIRWQLTIDPLTRPVNVDLGELELALINLVVNARHAMPDGGTLKVCACNAPPHPDDQQPMVKVEVEDTGVGIPQELLGKVLEPFFTTRSKGAGSGLGLSQVQGFCQQAGGFVRIDSQVGQGTTVAMHLPAAEVSEASTDTPGGAQATQALHGRLLLVEDNEDVGATTEMVLKAAGLEVTRVNSADAALALLEGKALLPDIVLSDIAMPGSMNGMGLAFELRRRHPRLPVLLTTGYAEQLSEASAGGMRVLQKPTPPDELLAELRAMMAARAAAQPAAGLTPALPAALPPALTPAPTPPH